MGRQFAELVTTALLATTSSSLGSKDWSSTIWMLFISGLLGFDALHGRSSKSSISNMSLANYQTGLNVVVLEVLIPLPGCATFLILFVHLIVTVVLLARPGGTPFRCCRIDACPA